MEIGCRVRVVELEDEDKECTDLKIGDTGIIVGLCDVCSVHFERNIKHSSRNWNDENQSYDMFEWQIETIQELDELEQYHKIGTLEECRAAVAKQKAIKPILCNEQTIRYILQYNCPSCGGVFTGTGIADYCYHCGQKLDWESEV